VKKLYNAFLTLIRDNQLTALAILVFFLGLFFRFWQLGNIPGGVSLPELKVIDTIKNLNLGNLWLGSNFDMGLYVYLAAIWTKFFGLTVLSLRSFSALCGSLTVFAAYHFIGHWFNKKIGIFAALLLSISSFHIALSRLILPEILLPLVLLGMFILLTRAYRTKNIWLFGLGGFVSALGFYTSTSFIMIPFLILLSGIYFFIRNKKFILSYKQELVVGLVGFAAAAVPFLVAFIIEPKGFLTDYGFGKSFWQIILNIGAIPTMLFTGGKTNWLVNVGSEPLLDPFIFVTAIFGIGLVALNASRRKYFFIISWFLIFWIFATLKRAITPVELVGLLLPVYTFAALILDYIINTWFVTFPHNRLAKLVLIVGIATFFALSAVYNIDKYFTAYKFNENVRLEFAQTPPIKLK
jgi:4-amino-4-deoxy-L-arabinose transferase-like glycosyltransferase